MGEVSDYEKMRLFLGFQNMSEIGIDDLTGALPSNVVSSERVKKSFIPYLKEKLVWS